MVVDPPRILSPSTSSLFASAFSPLRTKRRGGPALFGLGGARRKARQAVAAPAERRQRFDCVLDERGEARSRGGGVLGVVGVVQIIGVLKGDAEGLTEGAQRAELG